MASSKSQRSLGGPVKYYEKVIELFARRRLDTKKTVSQVRNRIAKDYKRSVGDWQNDKYQLLAESSWERDSNAMVAFEFTKDG